MHFFPHSDVLPPSPFYKTFLLKESPLRLSFNSFEIQFSFTRPKCTIQWLFVYLPDLCIYHHTQVRSNVCKCQKKPWTQSPSPRRWQPLISFVARLCCFWTFHTNGIMQYVAFRDWLVPDHHVFKVPPRSGPDQRCTTPHSLSWLSNSPLHAPSTLYLFTCWWTFGLFPLFGDYE